MFGNLFFSLHDLHPTGTHSKNFIKKKRPQNPTFFSEMCLMYAYNAYIEKIFNTHHIKCIVSLLYDLYGYITDIWYFIEKTKISKLRKNPNFTVQVMLKTQAKFEKR